jgi:hypothetical protein
MAALDEHYKVTDDVIDDVTDDVTDDVIGGVGLGRRFAASSADSIIHETSPHSPRASPFKLHSSGLTVSSVHLFQSQLSLRRLLDRGLRGRPDQRRRLRTRGVLRSRTSKTYRLRCHTNHTSRAQKIRRMFFPISMHFNVNFRALFLGNRESDFL